MMLKDPGQRPTGQTTIQLKGSGSRKFPVPFWKFCAAFVQAGICWKSDMEIDYATFSPWSFDEQMKNKRHGLKSDTRQRFTILKKAEIIETFLQMKAWIDRAINDQYTREVICPFMTANHPPDQEKLMFCDNLDAQKTQSFLSLLRDVGCSRYLTPPETTDLTQAFDNGLGRLQKYLIGVQLDEWLEEEENLEKWENSKITAS